MRLTICDGTLSAVFTRFRSAEASWLRQIALDLPLAALVIDFRHAEEFPNSALASLADLLEQLPSTRVELRGMTSHQARLLEYLRGNFTGEAHGGDATRPEQPGTAASPHG